MKFVVIVYFACVFFFYTFNDEYAVQGHSTLEEYKLYPENGNCYGMYGPQENVTSHSCQKPINFEKYSCIQLHKREEYCLELHTPTEEQIQLLCEDTEQEILSHHSLEELNICFKVVKTDGTIKEICQRKLDDYSIALTTPDNFTILLYSHFCYTHFPSDEKDNYKKFISEYKYQPTRQSCYKIYRMDQEISPYTCLNEEVFDGCLQELTEFNNTEGIVTQNNETVITRYLEGNTMIPDNNCLEIYTPDGKRHESCLQKVEERCVGFTTPSNLTVLVECYFCSESNVVFTTPTFLGHTHQQTFIKDYIAQDKEGHHGHLWTTNFRILRKNGHIGLLEYARQSKVNGVWLFNHTCYGFTLDNDETIILECLTNHTQHILKGIEYGCYPVLNLTSGLERRQIVCSKFVSEDCVGIVTPLNFTVALSCYYNDNSIFRKYQIKYLGSVTHTFIFNVGDCYPVHSAGEANSQSCWKGWHHQKQACIQWTSARKVCKGLKLPNNDTVELICKNKDGYFDFLSEALCYRVNRYNGDVEEVCQEKFGDYGVGINIGNYSILLDSLDCQTYTSSSSRKIALKFIKEFSFNPDLRSCYKVYRPTQDISPYTCSSDEVYDACVNDLEDSKCWGITTQNNETIVLGCSKNGTVEKGASCFDVYEVDGKKNSTCLKRIEEQCVGVHTPSGLTVLFECRECFSTKGGPPFRYDQTFREEYRPFVKAAFRSLTQANFSFENYTKLKVYTPDHDITFTNCNHEIKQYQIHTLHGLNNCRGVILGNLETVVLECPHQTPENTGCYDIFEPTYDENNVVVHRKVANVCLEILNEWCVGIKTPKKWVVPLKCYLPRRGVCGLLGFPLRKPPPRE